MVIQNSVLRYSERVEIQKQRTEKINLQLINLHGYSKYWVKLTGPNLT